MTKKRIISKRSTAQKRADEKTFLKLIQQYEPKTKGEKTSTKKSPKVIKSDRKKSTKRIPSKTTAKEPVRLHSRKVQSSQERKSVSKRAATKRDAKARLVIESRKRNREQNDFHFKGVRSVDKKIALFKSQSKTAIKKQLARKGGKPPRGIIVTVFDKKGREHTRTSPLDFVVNENSILNFIDNMLSDMRDDFMEWKDMEGEPPDGDDNPYKDFNPDTISNISVKYIY